MERLVKYLANLNTCDSNWGLYVNPDDLDDFRIGQRCFENGGLLDEKVYVGSLESLSFGHQDVCNYDVMDLLERTEEGDYVIEGIVFNDPDDPRVADLLEERAEELAQYWAEEGAWNFVHFELPDILEEALEKRMSKS